MKLRCKHTRTRCIHGDEILARMKVYFFRFWKEPLVRRQACVDCGAALDRLPLCFFDRDRWELHEKGSYDG